MRLSFASSILLLSLVCFVASEPETYPAASEDASEIESKTCNANASNSNADPTCSHGNVNADAKNSSNVRSSDDDNDTVTDTSSDTHIPTYNPTCKFYLAPSSIPNAGFGIYTIEDIKASTLLTEVPDAPSIVVMDTEVHTAGEDGTSETSTVNTVENHGDYYWDGTSAGEFEALSVSESVMTFGSLCNYHTYLHNVKPYDSIYDDTMTSRASGSPGVGAYSYHSGYMFKSTRDIKAGEELFANYGEEWLDGRGTSKGFNNIPRREDFDHAGKILKTTIDGLEEADELNDIVLTTIKGVVKHLNKRTSSLIPDTVYGLEQITDNGRAAPVTSASDKSENGDSKSKDGDDDDDNPRKKMTGDNLAFNLAKKTLLPRSLNWIKREGMCMDNLVPQLSTLPHAGRGAFAQRFLAKGEMIVPAPLLQIMDYSSQFMYDVDINENGELFKVSQDEDEDDEEDEDDDEDDEYEDPIPSAFQMMYNYCYSHEETSIMLCPQSNAILINHCSTRQSYGGDCERYNNNEDPSQRGPNAEMRWATGGWDPDTEDWLDYSLTKIEGLVKRGKRGLSLEIVATRDIQPGEEVFIDYGKGWEDEWEQHVKDFVPYSSEKYVPVKEMNKLKKLRTLEELEYDPYPTNVRTVCAYFPDVGEIVEESEGEDESDPDRSWVDDGSIYTLDNPDYQEYGWLWECQVLKREDDEGKTYTVELVSKRGVDTTWSTAGKSRHLTNYPRDSISFVNEIYQSDQHLLGVFRSYIRIPDEIFPQQWRDLEIEDDEEDDEE